MSNDDDQSSWQKRPGISRRSFVFGMGAATTLTAVQILLEGEAHGQDIKPPAAKAAGAAGIPDIVPRFTVPAGLEIKVDPTPTKIPVIDELTKAPVNEYLAWGINRHYGKPPPIMEINTHVTLTGTAPPDPKALLSTRLLRPEDFTKPEAGRPFIRFGQHKIEGIDQDSVVLFFNLRPGENLQLNYMPNTVIVDEHKGVVKPDPARDTFDKEGKLWVREYSDKEAKRSYRVAIIVPKTEYVSSDVTLPGLMRVSQKHEAYDMEQLGKYIIDYTTPAKIGELGRYLNNNPQMVGKKIGERVSEFEARTYAHDRIDAAMWNMFANIAIDAGFRPNKEKLRESYDALVAPAEGKTPGERRKNKMAEIDELYEAMKVRRKKSVDAGKTDFIFSEAEMDAFFKCAEREGVKNQCYLLEYAVKVETSYQAAAKAAAARSK